MEQPKPRGRPFQKGQSGNPKGRPPKTRDLTAQLTQTLGKTLEIDGKHISGKRFVASLVGQALTDRCVKFADGTTMALDLDQWLGLVKWVYQHIDGPPRAELDLTHDGGVIIRVVYEDADGNPADLAPGAETSGE